MTVAECAAWLKGGDAYLLLTHKNPDGDTVMSAVALCRALRRKNKRAYLYRNPQIVGKYLGAAEKLFAPESFVPQRVVSVDISADTLFPRDWIGKVDLCIDHHASNSGFASMTVVEPESSSCGEIVMQVIRELTGKLTKAEATLLYVALTTDTGAFQYANVNEATYQAAAELLRFGAEHAEVMKTFFRKTSPQRLRLEGEIYSNLHFYCEGKLVIAQVTQAMLIRSGATEDDLDDLAGLSGRAEGAEMNITIRELENGHSKISVRSAPGVSSIIVCEAFGGGGHTMAAGCTIEASPERAEQLLLDVIDALKILK